MIQPNDKFNTICNAFFDNECENCPIRKPCESDNDLEPAAYIIKMNNAADQINLGDLS